MGFIDRIRAWFVAEATAPPPKEAPYAEPVGAPTQVDPISAADRKNTATIVNAALRTAQERDRKSRYTDFDAMDNSDVAAMLDAVVGAALTFDDVASGRGFKIECDTPRPEELLRAAVKATRLDELTEELLRAMLKYGDGFAEPIFVGSDLVGCQTYTPSEMFRNQDDKGRLSKGKDDNGLWTAFQQKRNGQAVAGWQPWEIVHFKLWPDRKLAYSKKGLLDDIRSDWRKLMLVEQGMVVARVTRAYPRRVHMLDMTGLDRQEQERKLSSYIARMTNKVFGKKPVSQDNLPTVDVSEDLYVSTGYRPDSAGKLVPLLNEVKTEDPAIAGLAEMGDVQYLRQKLWSFVPADVVGIRRNTSGDLDSQDLAYARFLRRCQTQLEAGIRAILDQALMAKGMLGVEYRVIFPVITVGAAWKHSDARFRDSMTLRNYLEMDVISRRYALKRSFNLSDREVDSIWDEILEERSSALFLPVAFRNGQPSAATNPDPAQPTIGSPGVNQIDNPKDDAKPEKTSAPTGPTVVGDPIVVGGTGAITKSGISRGTKMSKITRGQMGGAAG